ncbi:MAG: acyl carrier protein [Lachnospiraceae bacterium]|nr:acyl carrier protein [Lachnospiraceae bacterium]
MEFDIMRHIVADVLQVDPNEVKPTTTFVDDLGADSLDLMRVLILMQEKFNIVLQKSSIYRLVKIQDAVDMIKDAKSN